MLISVLITNYNNEKFITRAVSSVLNQNYDNLEIIIVDDGSNDNSVRIIQSKYGDLPFIKLFVKNNGGQASALNKAFVESTGDVICILDSDDVYLNGKLKKIADIFRSNPDIDIILHRVIPIDENDNVIGLPIPKVFDDNINVDFLIKNGGRFSYPPASGMNFRRRSIENIFPLDERFVRNADGILIELAAYQSKIYTLYDILSGFRLHSSNLSSSILKSYPNLEIIKKEKQMERLFEEAHRKYLSKNINETTASTYYFRNRPNYEERQIIENLFYGKEIKILLKNSKIRRKRKMIWKLIYFINLFSNKAAIKILQLWWSNNIIKRILLYFKIKKYKDIVKN